jgi:hypothetical protein
MSSSLFSSFQEIQNVNQVFSQMHVRVVYLFFYIFLGLDTIPENESAGYVHATEAINLYIRRIVIFLYSLSSFCWTKCMILLHPDPVSATTTTENNNNNPNLRLAYKTQH